MFKLFSRNLAQFHNHSYPTGEGRPNILFRWQLRSAGGRSPGPAGGRAALVGADAAQRREARRQQRRPGREGVGPRRGEGGPELRQAAAEVLLLRAAAVPVAAARHLHQSAAAVLGAPFSTVTTPIAASRKIISRSSN